MQGTSRAKQRARFLWPLVALVTLQPPQFKYKHIYSTIDNEIQQ
jgi:hypothetical protein